MLMDFAFPWLSNDQSFWLALGFAFVGGILGFLIEIFLSPRLRKIAQATSTVLDDLLLIAFKGKLALIGLLVGIYTSIQFLELSKKNLEFLQKSSSTIVILIITLVLGSLTGNLIKSYLKRVRGFLPSTSIIVHLVRIFIVIIGILLILQSLQIPIAPLITTLGIGGIAVALALQDTLSNFFAGIQVVLSQKVRPGDYIRLDSGQEGYVKDISWRNTTLITFTNNMIIIPNTKLGAALITNYDILREGLVFAVRIRVAYGSNLEKIERITLEVAQKVMQETEGTVKDFIPVIRYSIFNNLSIDFGVRLMCYRVEDKSAVEHEFIKQLYERYRIEDIEIPFIPQVSSAIELKPPGNVF